MSLRNTYTTKLCLQTKASPQELSRHMNAVPDQHYTELRLDPSFFDFFAGRGRIEMQMQPTDNGTILQCRLVPFLFKHSATLYFVLCSLIIWGTIAWLFPPNVFLLCFFVFYWLMTCFVAIYLVLAIMVAATLYLLISGTPVSLGYLLAAWIVGLLLVHLILAHHRGRLKKYLLTHLSPLDPTPCEAKS